MSGPSIMTLAMSQSTKEEYAPVELEVVFVFFRWGAELKTKRILILIYRVLHDGSQPQENKVSSL
jgi:hypothetical protein